MNLWDELLQEEPDVPRFYGVVMGIVTNNKDPERLGRVKVQFPWLSEDNESNWARVATPMAGKQMGLFLLPEVDDEVLVAFEQGDMDHPYIIGSIWNGKDKPPADNADGKNDLRFLKSRSGHIIMLNDQKGKEKIEIIDKSGKNSIVIETAKNNITITTNDKLNLKARGDISLESTGGNVSISGNQVEIKAKTTLSAQANSQMELKASGQTVIKGAIVKIN